MNKTSHLIDLSLLKTHPTFRAVFIARFISIVTLGILAITVPVQKPAVNPLARYRRSGASGRRVII